MADQTKTSSGNGQPDKAYESHDASHPSSVQVLNHASPATDNSDVEAVLTGWWQDLLGLESVGLDDDFFDLGGHSLIGVQLFSNIKQKYGCELGLSTLFDARTIRQLAELVNEASKPVKSEPKPWSPIVPIQPNGSRTPLFLIPGGYGTTVLPFREVALLLGADQPVYGFEAQMPAPNDEAEPLPARAARFVKELRSIQPKGPYSLMGWCGGGYVAYEMAQILTAAGQKVALLAIVDCSDPQHPRNWQEAMGFRTQRTAWRVRHFMKRGPIGIVRWVGSRSVALFQAIGLNSRRAMAKVSGKPAPASPTSPLAYDAVDDRALRNVSRYHPVSYPGKSLVVIGRDSWLFAGVEASRDPRLFWCKMSEGGSDVAVLPGDHMELLKAPISHLLAKELRLGIDKGAANGQ
jgi:thioesterase domain-containing protein/acyl carrier protein